MVGAWPEVVTCTAGISAGWRATVAANRDVVPALLRPHNGRSLRMPRGVLAW